MKSLLTLLVATLAWAPSNAQDGWRPLFNGTDLDGWTQLNGSALYEAVDGMIVGTTIHDTPNSFLATEEEFGDFFLEFEVIVDAPVNSGVQIRSLSTPDYQNGRVHGYQVEIDPSPRAWSGGIYDEARRGWLYPISRNEECRSAFINGAWNTYRVEAVGPSIRTWVNGVSCADLVDDMTASGFIGLQVHSVPDEQVGKHIRWRNIRIKTEGLVDGGAYFSRSAPQFNYIPNHLSDRQKREGWKLLWDGKTFNGWRGAKLDHFPKSGWTIADGVLTVEASGGGESAGAGDIITVETYSSFDLEVDFMITEGANSGIKYFVDPQLNRGEGSAIGLEYQILDDEAHPDAELGVKGNRRLASLYDLIPAYNQSEPGGRNRFNGVGKWNRARILVDGSHVEHWLNNMKVVDFERGTQMYRALVAYSKYKIWPDFGEAPEGHILLQEHGDEVHFRSIRIREIY